MKNEKRVCVLLPKTMHEQIWRKSGRLKVNLVAQSLMIEYLLDQDFQKRVKTRIREVLIEKNKAVPFLFGICTQISAFVL